MVDQVALREAFASYAEALLRHYDIGDVLYRLAEHVVSVLEIDGAGVSLAVSANQLRVVSATDERVARMESGQVQTDEGPCYLAYRGGQVVTCRDFRDDERWSRYRRIALDQGIRSVAGIPMPVGEDDVRIGALNLYMTAPRDWDDDDLAVAQLLANLASGYIASWGTHDEPTAITGRVRRALQRIAPSPDQP